MSSTNAVSISEVWNSDSMLWVYLTATKVTPLDNGEIDDESGWVDPKWSRWELYESRNDVTPIFQGCKRDYVAQWDSENAAYDDFIAELARATAEYGCNLWDNTGGTNHYALDYITNYETGVDMSYCVHAFTKGINREGLWDEYDVTF